MKSRALPILLALMIVFTSCDQQQTSETATPEASASQPVPTTPEASVSQPAQTTPEAVSPEPTTNVSYEVVLPNGELPPKEFVPLTPPPRRYAEITQTLIPQPDYGHIWPYIGGYATEMWMLGELYGLCDDAGRIICDPVYNQVRILEKDGIQLYMLTKNLLDEDWRNISKITLAKPDGSWANEYDDVLYECSEAEMGSGILCLWRRKVVYEYITICVNGKWGVIDYEGNEILPCSYNAPVCFSEGLAAILSDDGKTCSYIDKTGRIIIGPYNTPPQQEDPFDYSGRGPLPLNNGMLFCEGLARFYENGKYGIINHNGKVIIPAQYNFISSFRNGTAQFISGDKRGILNASGKVLLEPTESWFYQNEEGEVILDKPIGSVVIDLATGEQKPKPNGSGDTVMYSYSTKGVIIKLEDGELTFPDANNVVQLDNGSFALSNRDNTWEIINRSGDTLAGPFEGSADHLADGFIYVCNGNSSLTFGYDARYFELYDQTGGRVLSEKYRNIIPFDGRYLVRQDYSSGLLDENGNWAIKVSLYDYIQD